jgi:hypothetical protein
VEALHVFGRNSSDRHAHMIVFHARNGMISAHLLEAHHIFRTLVCLV